MKRPAGGGDHRPSSEEGDEELEAAEERCASK